MIRRRIAATLANTDQIPATLIEKRRLELPRPTIFLGQRIHARLRRAMRGHDESNNPRLGVSHPDLWHLFPVGGCGRPDKTCWIGRSGRLGRSSTNLVDRNWRMDIGNKYFFCASTSWWACDSSRRAQFEVRQVKRRSLNARTGHREMDQG